jgi:hypothetical protein
LVEFRPERGMLNISNFQSPFSTSWRIPWISILCNTQTCVGTMLSILCNILSGLAWMHDREYKDFPNSLSLRCADLLTGWDQAEGREPFAYPIIFRMIILCFKRYSDNCFRMGKLAENWGNASDQAY